MDVKDSFLTTKQLAKRWNLQVCTLNGWRWMDRGPKFQKLGYAVLYAIEDIEAWETKYPLLLKRPEHKGGAIYLGF